MNTKTIDFIVIVVLFALMVIGTIAYTNRVNDINNNKITIISDTEIDK